MGPRPGPLGPGEDGLASIELLAAGEERLLLRTASAEIVHLARSLWDPAPAAGTAPPGPFPGIELCVAIQPGSPTGPFPDTPAWAPAPGGWLATLGTEAGLAIDVAAARVNGRLSGRLLAAAPSVAARVVLETPVALLLSHRGFQPLHAGAVTGPRGAVLLRGAQGAGKSTLVGAAFRAGLAVLGDESVLVSRTDPDLVAASVRELTLREDAAALLGLTGRTTPTHVGGEMKRRVELFPGTGPVGRTARRVATVLLGPRDPGPARLEPLTGTRFVEAFRAGGIPQERLGRADPDLPARAWAGSGLLLCGASDLDGAVTLLASLVG